MSHTSPANLARLVGRMRRARVLVVGDLMLDEFIWGQVDRISPEAPVPVVWIQSESVMPGGAANVANNLRSLGAQVMVAGVVGDDRWGGILLDELAARRIDASRIVQAARLTTVKTRVIAHHQQVVRVDREQPVALPETVILRLIDRILAALPRVDAVVIEDYGKGVITRQLLEAVVPRARQQRKLVMVDPKEEHFDLYHGVTALTPNRAEAGRMVGRRLAHEADVIQAGEELVRRLACDGVLITLGEEGMCLFQAQAPRVWIPTVAQEVFDVAGAGDTVIATFTAALAAGATMEQAARLANYAAGIVVGKLGVATVTPAELRARLLGRGRASSTARRTASPRPHR